MKKRLLCTLSPTLILCLSTSVFAQSTFSKGFFDKPSIDYSRPSYPQYPEPGNDYQRARDYVNDSILRWMEEHYSSCTDIFTCADVNGVSHMRELEENCQQRGQCPTATDRTPGVTVSIPDQPTAQAYVEQGRTFLRRAKASTLTYERQYLLAQSMDSMGRAIALNPHFSTPHLIRAVINTSFEPLNRPAAYSDIMHAIEIEPTADAYSLLGDFRYAEGDFQGAVESYNSALRFNPSPEYAARISQVRDNALQIIQAQNAPTPLPSAANSGLSDAEIVFMIEAQRRQAQEQQESWNRIRQQAEMYR